MDTNYSLRPKNEKEKTNREKFDSITQFELQSNQYKVNWFEMISNSYQLSVAGITQSV